MSLDNGIEVTYIYHRIIFATLMCYLVFKYNAILKFSQSIHRQRQQFSQYPMLNPRAAMKPPGFLGSHGMPGCATHMCYGSPSLGGIKFELANGTGIHSSSQKMQHLPIETLGHW